MENQLHCDATTCVHNYDHFCFAAMIQIRDRNVPEGSSMYCNTYARRRALGLLSSMRNEKISSLKRERLPLGQRYPAITCSATHCSNNTGYGCRAVRVLIVHPDAEFSRHTLCQTFLSLKADET